MWWGFRRTWLRNTKIWCVRGGESKWYMCDLGLQTIVHGKPQPHRFLQKHFQNGNPGLPAEVAPATTFALENDADGQREVVPLTSAHVYVEPGPGDDGQDVLVPLLDELPVDEPPPPPPQATSVVPSSVVGAADVAGSARSCCSVGYLQWLDVRLAVSRWRPFPNDPVMPALG